MICTYTTCAPKDLGFTIQFSFKEFLSFSICANPVCLKTYQAFFNFIIAKTCRHPPANALLFIPKMYIKSTS